MSIEVDAPAETPLVAHAPPPQPAAAAPASRTSQPRQQSFLQALKQAYDVDTADVRLRCAASLNLRPKQPNFLVYASIDTERNLPAASVVGGKGPDLWGPLWIYFTLVFAVFFAATTSGLFNQTLNETDVQLLTAASGTLAMFTFAAPVGEWLIIQYMDLAPQLTLLQIVSLFGYAGTSWVPAVIVAGSPLGARAWVGNTAALAVRTTAISAAFLSSAYFVYGNLYKVMTVHSSDSVAVNKGKITMFTVGGVLLHAALAVAVLVLISIASDDMKSV